ncbi:MAG: hypothetical protein U0132_06675 [Gemmatimonadaceae bacterium]
MLFDHALAHGQSDTGAGVLRTRVESLEDPENPVEVLRVNANTIVVDGERPRILMTFGTDPNMAASRRETSGHSR